ncbi:MAG TPA: hypothetical protein VGL11_01260 [Candidatus Binatia bacterium]
MVGFTPIIFLAALFIIACTSPEISRTRGGGPGADVGARPKVVRMHDGADPFAKTPQIIKTKHPPLAPARQAEQLSRR